MSPGSGGEEEEAEKEGEKKELPFVLDEYDERMELFLDDLPEGTTSVSLMCPKLTTLSNYWPASVTKISIRGCAQLTGMPNHWPTLATDIDLDGCTHLTAVPGIPPSTVKVFNITGCEALPECVRNLDRFEVNSATDWDHLAAVLFAVELERHLQRATTDLPVIERYIESFLIDDFATGDDCQKGGRFVTCSKFQDFVGGSFVMPVWPADKQKRQDVSAEDEKRILDKNQIKLPSASRSASGNARLRRLTSIAHLVNPAHNFLGQLLALPSWTQARLFQSEVSLSRQTYTASHTN
jgi:hypothetical protein